MLLFGWLVPAHLRAVDVSVVEKAGRKTPSLIERGLALVREKKLGAAQLLLESAREQRLAYRQELAIAATDLAAAHPGWVTWGGGEPRLEGFFGTPATNHETEAGATASSTSVTQALLQTDEPARSPSRVGQPITEWLVRQENRQKALDLLGASRSPVVQEILRGRELTNTLIFSASKSAAGQALDTALALCGLLVEEGQLTVGVSNHIYGVAAQANGGGSSQPLEQVLLDLMSLGQRLNWCQLAVFGGRIEDAEILRRLAAQARKADSEGQLPALFSAVLLSSRPAEVAQYLSNFSETGLRDMGECLRFGAGGVDELLKRDQRLYNSSFRQRLAGYAPFGQFGGLVANYSWRKPEFALMLKWLLYLASGFWIAAGLHFSRPPVSALERPLQVRGFHVAREVLFALGFLVVVLLLSEPFLAQESQKEQLPFRLRLPSVGSVVAAGNAGMRSTFMNNLSLLTLLLFFVLQALIYTACLVKLAEIRRQKMPPRVKLKLLENEDHLFDAGLYLGFAGTIISLILVSLGVIKPSLMAAYSSTSFGIIFVSVFKICHLRPERRKLLLEAEAQSAESVAPVLGRDLVTSS
jgi:hypothetical protein